MSISAILFLCLGEGINRRGIRMVLTKERVLKITKHNQKIDCIDWDEPFKALIWLKGGWTWDRLDGNRTIEGFNLLGIPYDEPDSENYLKERLSDIEPIR
jgi:hypothetical protein